MYMCLLEYKCITCKQDPTETGKVIRSAENGVTGGCEPLCRCWELNKVLCKSSKLLTAESSLQL